MMIVVADSGSTKCDWLIYDAETHQTELTHTMGFNPYFHDAERIASGIRENAVLLSAAAKIHAVYFYCAGGSSEEMRSIAADGLRNIFSSARIDVFHDLEGAVRATCGVEKGIACILGTGSNSCYFDGRQMIEVVPSLGYILGDEGGGSWYGRRLLKDYLYLRMPAEVNAAFEEKYHPDKNEILRRVYRMPHANVYLASFSPFLSAHREHPYIRRIVREGFSEFIQAHVCCYMQYREVPVHFVGSLAVHFCDDLQAVCQEAGIQIGKITREPVYGLLEYHTHSAK